MYGEGTGWGRFVAEPLDDHPVELFLQVLVLLVGVLVPPPVPVKEVGDESLSKKHLAAPEHAAPATVACVVGTIQDGELFAVSQPVNNTFTNESINWFEMYHHILE